MRKAKAMAREGKPEEPLANEMVRGLVGAARAAVDAERPTLPDVEWECAIETPAGLELIRVTCREDIDPMSIARRDYAEEHGLSLCDVLPVTFRWIRDLNQEDER